MTKTPIKHVSDTALWVAAYRADETKRPDALFRDPLADRLLGDEGHKIAQQMKQAHFVAWSVIIRTCIIDSYVQSVLTEGVDTVLNLGAGLDTRPYRMNLPRALRWIEVDYPSMIAMKEERLRGEVTHCHLERVALDLSDATKRDTFFTKISAESRKVLVITEGVIPYLTNDETASLARSLRAQANFQYWVMEYLSPQFMEYADKKRLHHKQLQNAPFKFRPADWLAFFNAQGWQEEDIRYLPEEGERLRRPPPMSLLMRLMLLVTPRGRLQAFSKMSGYALMKPL